MDSGTDVSLGAPFPYSVQEPTPWEVLRLPLAQGLRCSRDIKVRNDASPSHACRDLKRSGSLWVAEP